MAHDLYETNNIGGKTVYLDGRLLIQIRSGVVTAFQSHNKREADLIQKILIAEGLSEQYSSIPGMLVNYIGGIPNVKKADNK
jgi:hypothetical protein